MSYAKALKFRIKFQIFNNITSILGRDNYLLKWRGPFKRSDAEKRYPANMEADTKRLVLNVK